MVTDLAWRRTPTRVAYTTFDLGITMTALIMSLLLLLRMLESPKPGDTHAWPRV